MSSKKRGAKLVPATAVILIGLTLSACGSSSAVSVPAGTRSAALSEGATAAGYTQPKPWYRSGKHTVAFQSPTGNILCGIASDNPNQLLCKTKNNDNAVVLNPFGRMNTNSTVGFGGAHEAILYYGHEWWSRDFYCWSKFDGTYCRSLYSRHGFKIDRDGIQDWIWHSTVLHGFNHGGSGGGGGYVPPPATVGSGNGYPVECADGTWSDSGGIQGACSDHGGELNGVSAPPAATGGSGYVPYPTIPNYSNGNGYPVECADGTWSDSGGIQGACSDHGGEM